MSIKSFSPDLLSLQIPDAEFVVCDVETTGLNPERCRITEIALVRVIDGKITDRFQTLINPKQFITWEISRLTGITNEMVYSAPSADEVIHDIREFIGEAIFVGHNVRFDRSFIDATFIRHGMEPLSIPNLCTARLARRLVPKLAKRNLSALSRHMGITINNRHRAGGDAEGTAMILLRFIETLNSDFDITDVADLLAFQNKPVYRITGPPKHLTRLKENLSEVPNSSGVYFFHDRYGHIIYIGKAKDLRERVHSYFYHNIGHTEKVQKLIKAVHSISWKKAETELSALLMEAQYIRLHQPRFNTLLKNSRKYPFIRINTGDEYPKVTWGYEISDDGAEYFGPFSSRFAVEEALDSIDRLFLLRECDGKINPRPKRSSCLYFDIARCGAPCNGRQTREEYMQEVQAVVNFLHGRYDEILDSLRTKMEEKAAALDFENAAVIRDRLLSLQRIIIQQQTMTRSVREQNLVIITPAKRTLVEVHLIKSGMLVHKMLIDQKNIIVSEISKALTDAFYSKQEELFKGTKEDITQMRIIAFWCMTRRSESSVIDADLYPESSELRKTTIEKITNAGRI